MSKEKEKVTHISKSYVGKVVEIFFEASNISETQIDFWMCFSCFSVILSEPNEMQRRKNFVEI